MEKEREKERKREREQRMIKKIEIDTHLLVKWNQQIKLGRFRKIPLRTPPNYIKKWHYKTILQENM